MVNAHIHPVITESMKGKHYKDYYKVRTFDINIPNDMASGGQFWDCQISWQPSRIKCIMLPWTSKFSFLHNYRPEAWDVNVCLSQNIICYEICTSDLSDTFTSPVSKLNLRQTSRHKHSQIQALRSLLGKPLIFRGNCWKTAFSWKSKDKNTWRNKKI